MSAQAISVPAIESGIPTLRPVERMGGKALKLFNALVIGATPALMLGVIAANGGLKNPWVIPLALMTVLVNLLIMTLDLRYGLAMFILAAGLSPKLPGLYNNLRVEDFVFVLVFTLWILKNLRAGVLPRVRSPIIVPFICVTLMGLFSTAWGAMIGAIPDPLYATFLQLKRLEYFLIFWVVATSVKSEGWLRLLTLVFVASGAGAAMWGLVHAEDDDSTTEEVKRVSGPQGENYNTLSGYLVICIGVGLACIPAFRRGSMRTFLLICTGVAASGLLWSFSREGYIMLAGALAVFGFTRHRWILLLAAFAMAAVFLVAEPVRDTVEDTVHKISVAQTDDPGSNSLTARLHGWQYRWEGWFLKQPLIGNGVGSVPLSIDSEYLMRACEMGVIGLMIFIWWLVSVWKAVKQSVRMRAFVNLLGIGLMAAFVGLLIQGFVGASFTTIRTMEPFFFLLGLVAAGYQLAVRDARDRQSAAAEREPAPVESDPAHPRLQPV